MRDSARDAGSSGFPQVSDDLVARIREEAGLVVDRKIGRYQTWARGFAVGLGLFLAVAVTWGLMDKGDLIQTLHNKAFPPEGRGQIAISYESQIVLRAGDTQSSMQSVAFYAECDQRVDMYAHLTQRPLGEGEPLTVIVEVDGISITGLVPGYAGVFMDISEKMDCEAEDRHDYVHQITFMLDDEQLDSGRVGDAAEVVILCVVLVYGGGR